MACRYQARTNNIDSELYKKILDIYTVNNVELTELANSAYSVIHTDRFKSFFGDFIKAYEESYQNDPMMSEMVDENGEPLLFEDDRGEWYFESPDRSRQMYITGEFSSMSVEEVEDVTQNITHHIYDKISSNNLITREDFEQFSIENSLEEVVDEYLFYGEDSLKEQAKESQNKELVNLLMKIAYNKKGIIGRVKDFFNKRGIEIQEAIEEEEDQIYGRTSFEVNSKDKATFNIKLMLSFIPSTEKSIVGYKFVPFDKVWGFLEPKLAGYTDTLGDTMDSVYDKQIRTLMSYTQDVPWVNTLLGYLKEADQNTIRQFKLAFDKEFANYTSATFNPNNKQWKIFRSQQNSPAKKLIDRWFERFINTKVKGEKVQDLTSVRNRVEKAVKDQSLEGIKAAFSEIGIQLNDRTLRDKEVTKLGDGLNRVIDDLQKKPLIKEGKYQNIFSNQLTFLEPLAAEQSDLEGDLTENTVIVGTKQYWEFGNYSAMTDFFERIKQGDISQLKELLVKHPNSIWLNHIYDNLNNQEALDKIKVQIFSTFRLDKQGDNAVTNKNITLNDLLAVQVMEMLDVHKDGLSTFPILTMGDKSTIRKISGMPFHKVSYDGQSFNSKITDIFYGYFLDEYERIKQAYDDLFVDPIPENERIIYYHTDEEGYTISVEYEEGEKKFKDYQEAKKFSVQNNGNITFLGNALNFQAIPIGRPDYLFRNDDRPYETIDNEGDVRDFINDWLLTSINDSLTEIKRKGINENNIDRDLLKKYDNINSLLADYTVNGMISNIESTKNLYGGISYFKNFTEVNKRAQALGIDGLRLSLGETEGDHLFKAAVVDNVIFQSQYLESLEDEFGKDSPEVNAYKKTNRTDAQAWISPKRWKFILERLGRWNDNLEKVYQKLEKGEKLSKEEFGSISAQPLKGVYYGVVNGVPTYLKYSQAVLIPSVVKDAGMGKLLKRMNDTNDPVDEVITLDGVKVGAFQTTNIANENGTDVAEDVELNSFTLDNRNWRLQQDLPTKGYSETDIGSQLMKNIIANFKLDQEVFDGLMRDISELSDIEADKIRQDLNLDNLDRGKLDKLILRELRDRNAGSNILRAIEKGTPYEAIPQHLTKIENILFSYVKKRVTKIQTLGASLIQASSFGMDKLTESELNAMYWFTDDPKEIKRLKEKGLAAPRKGKPGEVLITGQWLTKYIPNWRNVPYSKLKEVVDERIFDIVGYRIPNQGMSSNDNLRVAGILPDYMGDIIIPYAEITTKTGSDFDIDKMFIMMPEFSAQPEDNWYQKARKKAPEVDEMLTKIYEKDETWTFNDEDSVELEDLEKLVTKAIRKDYTGKEYGRILYRYMELYMPEIKYKSLAYSTEGRKGTKNRITKTYWDILNHPDNFREKMQPLDSKFLKDSIENLWDSKPEKPTSDLNFFDPVNQLRVKYNYLGGKAGVGQTANHVVDHPLAQIAEMSIMVDDVFRLYGENAGEYPISQILSSFLNAYVDIAKDDYIVRGNHNTFTANVAFLLIRSGLPLDNVNAFLMQDILFDLVEETNLQDSKIFDKFKDGKRRANPIQKVLTRNSLGDLDITSDDKRIPDLKEIDAFSFDDLKDLDFLKKQLKNPNPDVQAQILKTFIKFQQPAKILRESVVATKQDVNGAGNDLATLWGYQDLFLKTIQDPSLVNFDEKFRKTYFKSLYANSIDLLDDITRKIFKFTEQRDFINQVSSAIGEYPLTDSKLLRSNIGFARAMWYSQIPVLKEDNIERLFTELPKRVYELREQEDNFFLNSIEIQFGNYSFMGVNQARKGSNTFMESMYEGWKDLMNKDFELATDLVKHAFYSTAFTSKINSLVPYIPHEWMYESGFKHQIQESDIKLDLDVFFKSNTQSGRIVPTISKKLKRKKYKDYNLDTAFVISDDSYLVESDKGEQPYPYVNFNNSLYKLVNFVQLDDGFEAAYMKTNKLGYHKFGNHIYEFTDQSVINTNHETEKGFPMLTDTRAGYSGRPIDYFIPEEQQKEETKLPYDSLTKNGLPINELNITKDQWDQLTREEQERTIECN